MSIERSRRAATGFLRDFQEFALKEDVMDLAIAVSVGAAFGKIVTAFTEDMIMPLINPLLAMTGKSWWEWTIPPGIRIGIFKYCT